MNQDRDSDQENVMGGSRSRKEQLPQNSEPVSKEKAAAFKKQGARASSPDATEAASDVGNLLRGAYRQTVEEAIPPDLLDLLNKLE